MFFNKRQINLFLGKKGEFTNLQRNSLSISTDLNATYVEVCVHAHRVCRAHKNDTGRGRWCALVISIHCAIAKMRKNPARARARFFRPLLIPPVIASFHLSLACSFERCVLREK